MHDEKKKQIRVAWLFPSLARGYYWQPVFKEFTQQLPETTIFTGLWPGFAQGYENAFKVRTLSGVRFVALKKRRDGASVRSYGLDEELAKTLVHTLEPVVGADHVRASVHVEYELGTSEDTQETYDPKITAHNSTSEHYMGEYRTRAASPRSSFSGLKLPSSSEVISHETPTRA